MGPSVGIVEELDPPSNVLVEASPFDGHDREACEALLSTDPPEETAAIVVTTQGSPDRWIDRWRSGMGDLPATVGFVCVDQSNRSGVAGVAANGGSPAADLDGAVQVEAVPNPENLTEIGIQLNEYMTSWSDWNPSLCFNSVTTLLQFVEFEQAFRFLHYLGGRLSAVDGIGHYHVEPEAHDERTRNKLAHLFDVRVRRTEDDEWVVQRR